MQNPNKKQDELEWWKKNGWNMCILETFQVGNQFEYSQLEVGGKAPQSQSRPVERVSKSWENIHMGMARYPQY